MKKLIVVLALFQIVNLYAQDISYVVVEDNPGANPNTFVNLEWFGMDGSRKSNSGFFVGVDGNYQIANKLGVEGNLRVKYLNFDKPDSGPLLNFEIGANYKIASFEKKKMIKIITSSSFFDKYNSNGSTTRTTTEKYFETEGLVQKEFFLRGGTTYRRNSSELFAPFQFNSIQGTFSSLAIYSGINFQINKRINTDVTDGSEEYTAGNGLLFNLYADFLFSPLVNTPKVLAESPSRVGYRVGLQWYNTFPKGLFSKMMIFIEISNRPVENTVLTMGAGYSLFRK